MSAARERILASIRGALAGAPRGGGAGLEERSPAPVPARSRLDHAGQIALFIEEAGRVDTTVARVPGRGDVAGAVAAYLANHNLEPTVKAAPAASLKDIPWTERTTLGIEFGAAAETDRVGVSEAFAGIAETGTLMLVSGAGGPTGLAFLPETHVVVLAAGRIVGSYEDAWARLGAAGAMPRAVNWVTGPSRTADIELTLLLGAHGPRRLHVVVVDDEGA